METSFSPIIGNTFFLYFYKKTCDALGSNNNLFRNKYTIEKLLSSLIHVIYVFNFKKKFVCFCIENNNRLINFAPIALKT